MINILLIDDNSTNLTVLELLIEDYMEDHDINDFKIDKTTLPQEGLTIIQQQNYDILFLDIMMPELDGFSLLKILRTTNDIKQPIVVMATALGDKNSIDKEREYGANAYIVKPIREHAIDVVLSRYIEFLAKREKDSLQNDDFEDFEDFDEFEDFDDLDENTLQETELEKLLHKSYTHFSAIDFMEKYNYDLDIIQNKIDELEELVFNVFESADDDIELSYEIDNIINIFDAFNDFLFIFEELKDLAFAIGTLIQILKEINIEQITQKQQQMISQFVKTIVFDLIEFKEQVFIEQNAQNIYYLNASIASSCVQIAYILKK